MLLSKSSTCSRQFQAHAKLSFALMHVQTSLLDATNSASDMKCKIESNKDIKKDRTQLHSIKAAKQHGRVLLRAHWLPFRMMMGQDQKLLLVLRQVVSSHRHYWCKRGWIEVCEVVESEAPIFRNVREHCISAGPRVTT